MTSPTKVIFDTDIGDDIDDAIALALAVKWQSIELLGVVTVYRNTDLRSKIARALLSGWGRDDVPVFAGCDDPIKERYFSFPNEKTDLYGKPIIRHYSDYMNDFEYNRGSSDDYVCELIKKHPNEIVLVATGPLTNIANFIEYHPAEYALLKEVIVMGGYFGQPKPEWNIKCDPEAADIVLSSSRKIRLVSLDTTLKCVLSKEQVEMIGDGNIGNDRLSAMIDIWIGDQIKKKMPILHDPLAMGNVCCPFCHFSIKRIKVGLNGRERGITFFDQKSGNEIMLATDVDPTSFSDFVCSTICGQKKE